MDSAALIPTWIDGKLKPFDKLSAHRRGFRHMAVSVFVCDGQWLLLQQRAAGKYHSGLLWANTCCTHPHWEEDPADCAHRRLSEELGITGLPLTPRGQVEYRAEVGNNMVEHEVVSLFFAQASRDTLDLSPDPAEVAATKWITLSDLLTDMQENPASYTEWLKIYLHDHKDQIFS